MAKKTKGSLGKLTAQELQLFFDGIERDRKLAREIVDEHIKSVEGLAPRAKADEWLKFVAKTAEHEAFDWPSEHMAGYESFVYLASRGNLSDSQCAVVLSKLRQAERWHREYYYQNRSVELSPADYCPSKVNDHLLPDFWHEPGLAGTDAVAAALMRVVEACGVTGFDPWWERYAKSARDLLLSTGYEPFNLSLWCFNMSRSALAVSLLGDTLHVAFEACSARRGLRGDLLAWESEDFDRGAKYRPCINPAHAACLAVVGALIRPPSWNSTLEYSALLAIMETAKEEGCWAAYIHDCEFASITCTAIALHALALVRPTGWYEYAERAVAWLWTQQEEAGHWCDEGIADAEYITVLVLDAIDLVEGRDHVSFDPRPKLTSVHVDAPAIDWDGVRLSVDGREICRPSGRATNLICILNTFRDDGWPSRIDDPLPPDDSGQRRRDAIRKLNAIQKKIRFTSDGRGEGICWQMVEK